MKLNKQTHNLFTLNTCIKRKSLQLYKKYSEISYKIKYLLESFGCEKMNNFLKFSLVLGVYLIDLYKQDIVKLFCHVLLTLFLLVT